jgi:nitrate/TMAO reductase-like tetraheme cytochrome c subunit
MSAIKNLTLAVTLLVTGATHASKPLMPENQMLPIYKQECGTCHMAYPPGFLSKPAWGRVMNSLSRHYGTDASLDNQQVKEISQWLNRTAGTYKRVVSSSKEDRITTTEWFIRKHREIKPAVFQRAAIKSPANCAACHTTAAQGDFDDDNVRIPK